jgi:hypothetical protein
MKRADIDLLALTGARRDQLESASLIGRLGSDATATLRADEQERAAA